MQERSNEANSGVQKSDGDASLEDSGQVVYEGTSEVSVLVSSCQKCSGSAKGLIMPCHHRSVCRVVLSRLAVQEDFQGSEPGMMQGLADLEGLAQEMLRASGLPQVTDPSLS